ncbi:MAG: class II D-tagatose-bisphosphate aldolase, non-catalytic subunit [Synergistaceae bacterium]|jgi:D-tagatose-1,6-bisphosphate aldolase subunit GatZ/KbaZ|nr:class II D-tagatose-bisphosphate aldolase, non-catalytic subunit [Synergistaceae bacterium]
MGDDDVFAWMLHKREKGKNEKIGKTIGVYSVCSANSFVLEATLDHAAEEGAPVLIETTSNQVNQQGGYTGMTPEDFIRFIRGIAVNCGFPIERIILGGDHLGPLLWQDKPEAEAMRLGEELVSAYVAAGFTKIHLDASMRLADDPPDLEDEVIAVRTARLCVASEESFRRYRLPKDADSTPPVYVVGSEVPASGGDQENIRKDQREGSALCPICSTSPLAFLTSYAAFQRAFEAAGLADAMKRVVAFIVQPGMAFTGDKIFDYDRNAAAALCAALSEVGQPLVFEGHSTDYQTPEALAMLVEDGVAILKVGPALTFALREGLFALEAIERELIADGTPGLSDLSLSRFSETLEAAMLRDDRYWRNHYRREDGPERLRFQMRYSFFDRARYYLPLPEVEFSLQTLLRNLERTGLPLPLLSQYLPRTFERARRGLLGSGSAALTPRNVLKDCVRHCLRGYSTAAKPYS